MSKSMSVKFRRYAEECIVSARTATSEAGRNRFLDLAKLWMTAAQQIDDSIEAPPLSPRDDTPQFKS
jgi:hypothetical protein